MIFLIADLHLNHVNIIKYCNRPFSSVEKMNTVIVNNWNKVVKKDDTVYLIGDLLFKYEKRTIQISKETIYKRILVR